MSHCPIEVIRPEHSAILMSFHVELRANYRSFSKQRTHFERQRNMQHSYGIVYMSHSKDLYIWRHIVWTFGSWSYPNRITYIEETHMYITIRERNFPKNGEHILLQLSNSSDEQNINCWCDASAEDRLNSFYHTNIKRDRNRRDKMKNDVMWS